MKTKKVNRYYCDFCNKGGCSAGHMRHHEERCTLNPGRVCGMCVYAGNEHQPEGHTGLAGLVAIVNSWRPEELFGHDYGSVYNKAADRQLKTLRDAAGNCPACILAALRQAQPGHADGVSFAYKTEATAWLENYRPDQY